VFILIKGSAMMVIKSYKNIALAGILLASFTVFSKADIKKSRTINPEISTTFTEADQWKYLEYFILATPNNSIGLLDTHFDSAVALGSAAFSGYQVYTKETVGFKDFVKPGICVGIVATVYYKLIACFIKSSIYKNNLIEFLRNWSRHKEYTPVQFHELFDTLAEILVAQGEKVVGNYTHQVMELVLFNMTHQFKDRYKGNGLKPFEAVKALTDVLKNTQGLLV